MEYHLYEDSTRRFIQAEAAEMFSVPNPGERWSIQMDQQEVLVEIIEVGELRTVLGGRILMSQDVFVRRIF